MVTVQMENKDKLFRLRRIDDCQETDIALLDESDIHSRGLFKWKIYVGKGEEHFLSGRHHGRHQINFM